jgi:hypothetical protein
LVRRIESIANLRDRIKLTRQDALKFLQVPAKFYETFLSFV